jgi:hypothetical protein
LNLFNFERNKIFNGTAQAPGPKFLFLGANLWTKWSTEDLFLPPLVFVVVLGGQTFDGIHSDVDHALKLGINPLLGEGLWQRLVNWKSLNFIN